MATPEPPSYTPENAPSAVAQKLQRISVKDPKKVGEGRDSYIAYVVETDGNAVMRRYSEFESFRDTLIRLHPGCVLPPLPEKLPVTMMTLAVNKNPETTEVIERRRRRLESFINRVATHAFFASDRLLARFLEADSWAQVLASEVEKAPGGSLFALTLYEPKVAKPDSRFIEIWNQAHAFGQHANAVDRNVSKLTRRQADLASDFAELGACFNQFALSEKELNVALEKFGSTFDMSYLAAKFAVAKVEDEFLDPLQDHVFYVDSVKGALQRRDQLQVLTESSMEQVSDKRYMLKDLEAAAQAPPPPPSSNLFASLKSSMARIVDPNPEQTRQVKMAQLQSSIAQLEEDIEKANGNLTKASESLALDVKNYEKVKARELKLLMMAYAQAQVEYYQKLVQGWGFVVPVLLEIPDKRQ